MPLVMRLTHRETTIPMSQLPVASLIESFRDELLNNVLPFWMQHSIDKEYGGVMTSLDRDGSILDTDKSVWQQGRFSWLLGEMFNHGSLVEHAQREHWLDTAKRILEFVSRYCFDTSDGRLWFQVTRQGLPIRKRRYAFSESFAAIAYGEMAQACGDEEYAQQAESCFQQYIDHHSDSGKAAPKFTETRPVKSIGFPMIGIVTAQQLRDSIALESADDWIDRWIEEIRDNFCKPEINCVMETVGPGGELLNHFDGRTLNPGHAIEAAWFIMAEGRHRSDAALVELGCQMLDWMW